MSPEGDDALNAKFRLGNHPSEKTGVFQQPEYCRIPCNGVHIIKERCILAVFRSVEL